jgi:hypothetical protein
LRSAWASRSGGELGPDTRQATLATGVTAYVAGHAPAHVIVVNPRAGALGRPVPAAVGAGDPTGLWGDAPAG